jgi:hypothetical protein
MQAFADTRASQALIGLQVRNHDLQELMLLGFETTVPR